MTVVLGGEPDEVRSCTIVTTAANPSIAPLHDRMPVILKPDDYDIWLDPGMKDVAIVSQFLKPLDARLMRSFPVSNRVNRVENDDAECSAPVNVDPALQSQLFR